jgi:hypothetical protein
MNHVLEEGGMIPPLPFRSFPDVILGMRIHTDFRVWLWVYGKRLSMTPYDNNDDGVAMLWLSQFLEIAKTVFFEIPVLDEDVIRAVIRFSDGKAEARETQRAVSSTDGCKPEAVFDFVHDAGAIAASFRQTYGINLRRWKGHWFEFLELLRGLPSSCALGELIRLRTFDINGLPPGSRLRGRVAAAQRAAALPAPDCGERAAVLAELAEVFYDT